MYNRIMMKYSRLILIALLLIPVWAWSQNNTNSPYSKFGVGDLATTSYGRNTAIGGVGIAIRDASYLNMKNPASLTAIDTLSFLFETGVSGSTTFSSTSNHDENYWNANLTHVALGHRYTPWLMGRLTVMPYTNIGYDIRTIKGIIGESGKVQTDWSGTGGLNQISYSLGIKPFKYFSLGFDVGYLKGPYNETRSTISTASSYATYYSESSHYRGFLFKGGIQMNMNLDKQGSNLVLGAVITPKTKLFGEGEIEIKQQYPSSSSTALDSVYSGEERVKPIYIPMNYGVGASVTIKAKYLIAADYEFSGWNTMSQSRSYADQTIYSIGFEKLSQLNSLKFSERCAYRVGFRYDSGYIIAKEHTISDIRATLGVGFPIKKGRSTINAALEAGQRGTQSSGLVRERYLKMTVSMSMHDYWFRTRKFD